MGTLTRHTGLWACPVQDPWPFLLPATAAGGCFCLRGHQPSAIHSQGGHVCNRDGAPWEGEKEKPISFRHCLRAGVGLVPKGGSFGLSLAGGSKEQWLGAQALESDREQEHRVVTNVASESDSEGLGGLIDLHGTHQPCPDTENRPHTSAIVNPCTNPRTKALSPILKLATQLCHRKVTVCPRCHTACQLRKAGFENEFQMLKSMFQVRREIGQEK